MSLPVQLLFAAFFVLPFGYALYESLTSPLTGRFAGLRNLQLAVSSVPFWRSVQRMAYFGVIQVAAMVLLSLGLAFLIDSPLCAGKRAFRLLFFLPFAVPGVLAALMWGFLFSPQLDSLLSVPAHLGITNAPIDPLSPSVLLWSVMLVVTWEWTGYNMTLYLTSLASIPETVLEAAVIDGCSQIGLVRHIKLPLIRRMIMFTLVLSIIGTLQLFNEPQLLQAPVGYTPNMTIYNQAFTIGNLPLASAMSLILAAITVGASLIFYLLWRRVGPLATA